MQCISPIYVRPNHVPCGKCNFCLQMKQSQWAFRLNQELKKAKTASFLTLTYDDENIPTNQGQQTLSKRDLQLFFKKLRKYDAKKANLQRLKSIQDKRSPKIRVKGHEIPESGYNPKEWPNIKYYTVGEYGTKTKRPHYHSIMFNMKPETKEQLPEIWNQGHVKVGTVTPQSIAYVTKYVINKEEETPVNAQKPFALISKGIGKSYLSNARWHKSKGDLKPYAMMNGYKVTLPRYLKDKIFTKNQKLLLQQKAIEETDKQYLEELRKVAKNHKDPGAYMAQQIMHRHDNKFNSLNKKDVL